MSPYGLNDLSAYRDGRANQNGQTESGAEAMVSQVSPANGFAGHAPGRTFDRDKGPDSQGHSFHGKLTGMRIRAKLRQSNRHEIREIEETS